MKALKSINKNSWAFKFINWNFTFKKSTLPNNICSFYLHILLSFFMAPINGTGFVLAYLLKLETDIHEETEEEKISDDKFSRFILNVIGFLLAWLISIVFTLISSIMISIIIPQVASTILASVYFCAFIAIPLIFVYALIFRVFKIIVKKIKERYCNPIEFVD